MKVSVLEAKIFDLVATNINLLDKINELGTENIDLRI